MKNLLPLLLLAPMISIAGNSDEQRQAYERYVQCRAACADTLEQRTEKECFKVNDVMKHEECYLTIRNEYDQCSTKCVPHLPK